ncbi:MAG: hypothetical protein AB7S26_10440 [Sandaracinaceae bacterium]
MFSSSRFVVLLALTTALTPCIALAQDDGQPSSGQAASPNQLDEAARLTFESAREAFAAGDYETALQRFRQAYQLSARPGLLYNIAQTLDRLRRDQETVDALRQYIEAYPDAPNRSEVEARIRVLEDSLARSAPPPDPEPDPEPDPQHAVGNGGDHAQGGDQSGGSGIGILHPAIFIAVGGLALVAGGLSIWTGLTTLSLNDDYNAATTASSAQDLYDQANGYQLGTNILLFGAGGLAAVAVVCAILTDWDALSGSSDRRASLTPMFAAGPDGAALGVAGAFQ